MTTNLGNLPKQQGRASSSLNSRITAVSNKITSSKEALRQAIINKKASVPANPTFQQLINGVNSIKEGSIVNSGDCYAIDTLNNLIGTFPDPIVNTGRQYGIISVGDNNNIYFVTQDSFSKYNKNSNTLTKIVNDILGSSRNNYYPSIAYDLNNKNIYLTGGSGSTAGAYYNDCGVVNIETNTFF